MSSLALSTDEDSLCDAFRGLTTGRNSGAGRGRRNKERKSGAWTESTVQASDIPAFLADKYQAERGSFVPRASDGKPDMRFTHNRKFFNAAEKTKPVLKKDGRLDGRSHAARELQDIGVSVAEFRHLVDTGRDTQLREDERKAAMSRVNKIYHDVGESSKRAEAQLRQVAASAFYNSEYDRAVHNDGQHERGHAEALWRTVRAVIK